MSDGDGDASAVVPAAGENPWEFAADKTFKKQMLRKGVGLICPRDGSVCRVRIDPSGTTTEEFLSERSLHLRAGLSGVAEIVIGESDTELDDMLDKILQHMKPEELSRFSFQIHTKEKTAVQPALTGSSPVSAVEVQIELMSFQEVPELWELNPAQLVDSAKHHKERGVGWFKSGQTMYALRRFARAMRALLVIDQEALDNLAKENSGARELLGEFRSLICSLYLNIAAIQLQSSSYKSVVDNCTKALKFDPQNVKAYYRRGTAHARLLDKQSAKEDLLIALKMAPNDADIRRELRLLVGPNTEL
ncbi:uncharacterized protein LOC129588390 [Paramacrobiotus metropolitanus]|uniref:uncharacterized protein LOC129588390 n=1 Tax=Paramacrobiotus metropolitanus TaxID=2943436 RepID=UPI002445B139|nr:uncharacterized protein LOC129588390 [Paramacrobiotus metropolitanus]